MSQSRTNILGAVFGIGMNINSIIGSGIVTTAGMIWNSVKSPGIVLLLWFIGGIISMSGSLVYSELGVKHKDSGGELKYLQAAYPNPKLLISYLFSFMYILVIRPGITCAILHSAAKYFWYMINGPQNDNKIDIDEWNFPFSPFCSVKFIAIAILFIITAYHMINNRLANVINQTLSVIKLITYSIIAIAGIFRLILDWEISRTNWQKPLSVNKDFTAYPSAILLIMFSYNGWNNLNYSLDEFRSVENKFLVSNGISVVIVTFLYLLINIAFISVIPEDKIRLQDRRTVQIIAVPFFEKLFDNNVILVKIFEFLIVLSLIGTAASNIWSGSRVIVAAATSGFFPKYLHQLKIWHQYCNTPINALLAQFIWCMLFILFIGSSFVITSFELYSSFAMYSHWIFYLAIGIGLFVIRFKRYKDGNADPIITFKVSFPIAGIFILAGLFIIICSFFVDVQCPTSTSPDPVVCNQIERIQKMVPMFISYGFLFIGLIFWYYYWWETNKNDVTKEKSTECKEVEEVDVEVEREAVMTEEAIDNLYEDDEIDKDYEGSENASEIFANF
ncbi:2217_t:CDS:2 [Funneliformis caledonium]|uniref:2217_t:CDS:1 n=1 Tax=Funneliformis caledonium TaxID=1117310 RepID=A0A9N9GM59_9GLOM|nr:2217_t:CDS:2 [Funneliformis caledonium]